MDQGKGMSSIPGIEPGMSRAEKMKIYRLRWSKKPAGRKSASECQVRYLKTAKGKDRTKRNNDRIRAEQPILNEHHIRLRRKLKRWISHGDKYAEYAAHFEATFEPWMSWNNYGRHEIGKRRWCIGHRIPRSAYADTQSDADKCYNLENLFAQCAKQNAEQRDAMPDQATIGRLYHLIPDAW